MRMTAGDTRYTGVTHSCTKYMLHTEYLIHHDYHACVYEKMNCEKAQDMANRCSETSLHDPVCYV